MACARHKKQHLPMKTKGKSFSKTSFQLRMELKKGQEQGRDERTQKTTGHLQKYTADVR